MVFVSSICVLVFWIRDICISQRLTLKLVLLSRMDIDGGFQRKFYRLLSFFFIFILFVGSFIIVNASLLNREVYIYRMRVLSFPNSSNVSASNMWYWPFSAVTMASFFVAFKRVSCHCLDRLDGVQSSHFIARRRLYRSGFLTAILEHFSECASVRPLWMPSWVRICDQFLAVCCNVSFSQVSSINCN